MPAASSTAHHAAADRLRSLLLQVFLVGLVVLAGLLVFSTVAEATADVEDELEQVGP